MTSAQEPGTTAALDAGAALTPVSLLRHAREAMTQARGDVATEPV